MTILKDRPVALALILVAALSRLLPHPPNFAPIAAIALFGGIRLGGGAAYVMPLAALALSDLFLGFHATVPFVYGSFLAIAFLGTRLKDHATPGSVLAAALASSLLFFFATNLGTWAVGGLYPLTAEGLKACFTAAIPFYRNTMAGDLFFLAALFGIEALALRAARRVPAAA